MFYLLKFIKKKGPDVTLCSYRGVGLIWLSFMVYQPLQVI